MGNQTTNSFAGNFCPRGFESIAGINPNSVFLSTLRYIKSNFCSKLGKGYICGKDFSSFLVFIGVMVIKYLSLKKHVCVPVSDKFLV